MFDRGGLLVLCNRHVRANCTASTLTICRRAFAYFFQDQFSDRVSHRSGLIFAPGLTTPFTCPSLLSSLFYRLVDRPLFPRDVSRNRFTLKFLPVFGIVREHLRERVISITRLASRFKYDEFERQIEFLMLPRCTSIA